MNFLIWIGLYSNIRAPMLDYISGDAFRSLSKYIYEEKDAYGQNSGISLDRRIFKNSPGDIVFVQSYALDRFIKYIHPRISNPYILITHNSDDIIDAKYIDFLQDPKIIKWYTQNVDIDDEKIVPIPIGIENRYWYFKRTADIDLIEKVSKMDFQRDNYVYLNITPATFTQERQHVLDFFSNKPYVHWIKNRNYLEYLTDLKEHVFCLSPSGNGLDCHRTWEALLMGSIPIVRPFVKGTLKEAVGNNSMYRDLPVIVVKQWDEVTPKFLEQKLLEFSEAEFNYSKLYFSYWKNMILSEAERFKASLK